MLPTTDDVAAPRSSPTIALDNNAPDAVDSAESGKFSIILKLMFLVIVFSSKLQIPLAENSAKPLSAKKYHKIFFSSDYI